MSDKDSFPFWTDEWMDSQQKYIDSWAKMSEQMADTFQSKKGRNPWINALEEWESLVPNDNESQPYAQQMLDQGKAFFRMGEEISNFLKTLQDENKSTDTWQQTLQSQMDEIKKGFETNQSELSAFWNQTIEGWQQSMANSSIDPETLFKDFNPQQDSQDTVNLAYAEIYKRLASPSLGPDREKHEQYQKYIRLWLEFQRTNQEYNDAHQRVGTETIDRLMTKLISLSEADETIDSMREVYDLWVDCAEDAYADFAHTDEFQDIYGRMVNSLMALKNETQKRLDQTATSLGMPSAKGFESVLKRMQEMRRQIRSLQSGIDPSNEVIELRKEVSELREELASLKQALNNIKLSETKQITTKKKVTRKKVAKKKVATKKTSKR